MYPSLSTIDMAAVYQRDLLTTAGVASPSSRENNDARVGPLSASRTRLGTPALAGRVVFLQPARGTSSSSSHSWRSCLPHSGPGLSLLHHISGRLTPGSCNAISGQCLVVVHGEWQPGYLGCQKRPSPPRGAMT
jgi:hypothetical protein